MVLKGTDILDGVAIQDDWFPEINADIFISHSHGDCDLANGIAGWMNEEFGLRCFIDSNVWGYTNDLLRILKDYSALENTIRFYKRNKFLTECEILYLRVQQLHEEKTMSKLLVLLILPIDRNI